MRGWRGERILSDPEGGVQHIAFRVPVCDLDNIISELTEKGYPVISSFNTPIAIIVFFDTSKEMGVLM